MVGILKIITKMEKVGCPTFDSIALIENFARKVEI